MAVSAASRSASIGRECGIKDVDLRANVKDEILGRESNNALALLFEIFLQVELTVDK